MADIDVLGIKFELRGMEDGIRNLEKMDKVTDEVQATLKQLKKALEDIGKASNESYKDQVGAVQKLAAAKKQLEEASKKQAEAEVARAKARKLEASIDEKALDGKVRRENAYATQLDNSEKRQQSLINLRKKEQLIDEDVSKKQIANATALIKQRALESSITEKALDAKIRRENAYAKAIDQAAQREQALQKQKAQTAAAEELANERRQKAAHWEQKRLDTSSLLAAQESRLTNQNLVALERLNTYKLNQMSMIETRQLKANASIEQGAARLALQQEKFEYQKQRAAERAANGSVSAWQKFKDTMSTISDVTIGGFGIGMVVDKLSGVVKAADEMVLLDSRLKLATKSSAEFAEAQSRLRQSAIDTGLSLNAQTANYTQIERSTRSMGLSVQQLSFLTESFGKAAVVSGADAESFKSAITQLNQGFASGVVRGQEFNSVAEQAPAILEALAAGLRGNNKQFDELEKKGLLGVAALRKMAGEGKLVNSVTIPALMKGLQDTNKQFEQMPLTVERAFGMLSNKYKIWISDQNSATGSTKAFAESIKGVATNFDSIVNGVVIGAGLITSLIAGKVISSFVEMRVQGVKSFIETGRAARDSAASAVLWADATQNSVTQARKHLEVVSKIPGNVTAVKNATIALTDAENKNNLAIAAKNNALKEVANSYTFAGAASKGFGAVVGALGGPIGIAITALGLLATAWLNVESSAERAAKRSAAAAADIRNALAQNKLGDAEDELRKLTSEYDTAQKRSQSLVQQEQKLLALIAKSGPNALVGGRSIREGGAYAKDALDSVQAQLKVAAQEAGKLRKGVLDAEEIISKYRNPEKPSKITPIAVDEKTKKTPLPDETLGSDAALRNLERSLSLRQSAVEKEKQLLGYSNEESLAQLASLESRKLSLQWQQEEQKLSEESKKKMTAEARKQHNEVVAGFQAEKKLQLESLLVMQERRRLDNEEAKAKIDINTLNKGNIRQAEAEYSLAKEQSKVELASLDMAERMGDVRASVASERKKEVEISLQLQKNQVDMAKALADERVAQEAYNRAKANASVYGAEEVERRRQSLETAEDAVEAVKQENVALKEQLDLEKKLSILRTDGLSGAKKAISDYIDGLDNWYQTGYNIANESINLLEDAFVSFVETGKLSGAKLFKYLRDEFKKLAVQRIIIQPIMNGASSILSSLGSTFSGNFAGAANIGSVLSGLSGVGSMISGGLSGAAFNGAQAFATSGVGQWLGLSETTAEVGTIMTEAGTQLATAADAISTYGGYAKAAYDVFNAFKEGKGWGGAAGSAIGAYFGGAPGAFIGNKIGGFVDKTFSGGGGQKVGGEGAVGMSNLGLFPEGQTDALVQDALVSYQASLKDVAKKFGVSLENMSVAYGYETDPQGDAGNFFSSKAYLNGASIREVMAQKYEGDVADQMAKEFKTITVLALSGAGLKEDFQAAFKDFDVKNVTQEAVDKVVARLDEIFVVVSAFDKLGETFPQLTNLSISAKESIVSLAGGLDSLTSKLNTYYENFYSQEEQLAIKTSALAKEFENIGVKMPATREEFRKLVEVQDLNTEAGQKTYTSLLNVAGAFAEISPAATEVLSAVGSIAPEANNLSKSLEQVSPAAAEASGAVSAFVENLEDIDSLKGKVQAALDDVVAAIEAQQATLKQMYDSQVDFVKARLEEEEQTLKKAYDEQLALLSDKEKANKTALDAIEKEQEKLLPSLQNTVKNLSDVFNFLKQESEKLSEGLTKGQRQSAIADLLTISSRIKGGESFDVVAEDLKKLVPMLTQDNQDLYSSFEEWSRDQAQIQSVTSSLTLVAEEQLSSAQLLLDTTTAGFEANVQALQLVQEGIEKSRAELKETFDKNIAAVQLSAQATLASLEKQYNLSNNAFEAQKLQFKSVVDTLLGNQKATYDVVSAVKNLESTIGDFVNKALVTAQGALSAQFSAILSGFSETLNSVVSGVTPKVNGSHADGLPYVPFDGYIAELHQGERVLTRAEAEQYSANSDRTQALLRELIEICKANTRNTFYIEKKLDSWDGNGLPETRAV